jgi:ABC-type transporter Mla MlaB component
MDAEASRTVVFVIRGPLARADLAALTDRVGKLLARSRASVALCDLVDVEPDAVTVDALARLQLAARRNGCRVQVRGASNALCGLIELMGLKEVLCVPTGGAGVALTRPAT